MLPQELYVPFVLWGAATALTVYQIYKKKNLNHWLTRGALGVSLVLTTFVLVVLLAKAVTDACK